METAFLPPSVAQSVTRVLAHRGGAGIEPENTIRAIDHAIDIGVDWIEFDVRETADGELILHHDETVDRTTDGTGAVSEMTLEAVRALDAGEGAVVPTLDEAAALLDERGANAFVELKEAGIGERVVARLDDRNLLDRVVLTSGTPAIVEAVADSGIRVGGPIHEVDQEALRRVTDLGYEHVGIRYETVTRDLVDRVHDHGIEVAAWTVNDRADMERMVSLGCDILTTDRPGVARSVLRDRST